MPINWCRNLMIFNKYKRSQDLIILIQVKLISYLDFYIFRKEKSWNQFAFIDIIYWQLNNRRFQIIFVMFMSIIVSDTGMIRESNTNFTSEFPVIWYKCKIYFYVNCYIFKQVPNENDYQIITFQPNYSMRIQSLSYCHLLKH